MNAARIVTAMSPDRRAATEAYLAGDHSTETLHLARREIAAYTDRLVGRNRGIHHGGRNTLITAARAAYDQIAAELDQRGAL